MTHLLLIELTNEQVAWVAGGFVAAVVTIGTLAAAIKAIRGELWNPFNKGFLAPRRARRLKLLAAAEGFDEIVASTKRIEAELKTNGGHSIKDVVNRIDRKVEYLQARTRHQDETNEHATFELNELGNLIFANSVLCDMLNADERDLLYRNWVSKAVEPDRTRVLRELNDAIVNKMPLDTTIHFNIGLGSKTTLRIKASPTVRSGGELIGFFGRAERVDQ